LDVEPILPAAAMPVYSHSNPDWEHKTIKRHTELYYVGACPDEPGVAKESQVPTYAALRLHIDSWRWAGVPFYVRAGKLLSVTTTEVFIEFKLPPQVVFAEAVPSRGNHVRFRLNPQVAIAVGPSEAPGESMVVAH
jgi:glucose-6-phosphate 1-dehydrogenase